ncbi:MAG: hydroxylase [Pseudomonadota bacterium]
MKQTIAGVILLTVALCGTAMTADSTTENDAQVRLYYLEFVTPDVEATCQALSAQHGVSFGEPQLDFGNARIATLRGGGLIGVRAPMRADEAPIVRAYTLVEDIEKASADAEAAGAEFAMHATDMPGHGQFAIYFLGGLQHGLWQQSAPAAE